MGAELPQSRHQESQQLSLLTKKAIVGPMWPLDGGQAVSREEALMWAEVNPFSPTNSGEVLNPF